MNKKGFAVSGIIYSILILFLILIFGLLSILGGRKLVLDKMKNDLMSSLNDETISDIYKDNSGANYPRLADRMIPIIYDDTKGKWIYADIYEKWYDYDEKMWANAAVLKSDVVKTVGQEIEEDEIVLMYVWIPRFKYTIFNAYNESVSEQQIEIVFESGTNSTGTVKCVDAINQSDSNGNLISEVCTDTMNSNIVNNVSTYTHPAFTFGSEEIEGFWVGKFEVSTNDSICNDNPSVENCNKVSTITIKPNVLNWRYTSGSNFFESVQNITINYGINNTDSHIIKNMEWGAIAYLSHSVYGIGQEIYINNSGDTNTNASYTGRSGGDVGGSVSYSTYGTYTYDGKIINSDGTIENFASDITLGTKASTTGNVYGVYDMSGGAWEFVMGNMVDEATSFYSGNDEFISSPTKEYYDSYSYSTSYTTHDRGKLGDLTRESLLEHGSAIGGWYNDYAFIVAANYPWFIRGGCYVNNVYAGVFSFSRFKGGSGNYMTTRAVLIKY